MEVQPASKLKVADAPFDKPKQIIKSPTVSPVGFVTVTSPVVAVATADTDANATAKLVN